MNMTSAQMPLCLMTLHPEGLFAGGAVAALSRGRRHLFGMQLACFPRHLGVDPWGCLQGRCLLPGQE